jgi:hypothetical protein
MLTVYNYMSSGEANSSEIKRLVLRGSFTQTVGGVAGRPGAVRTDCGGLPRDLLGTILPDNDGVALNKTSKE